METIITFCAHTDDQIIGAGGTLAKYALEGKRVLTYIFAFGESSHPHYKKEVIVKTRIRESLKSERILGLNGIEYFGLKEGNFKEEMEKKNIKEKIIEIIKKEKPVKIFTHNLDDPHPDHRAVYNFIIDLLDEISYKGDVYSFNVWNFFNVRKRESPKLVVDITDTFKKKVEALKAHKSQKMTLFSLMWKVYFQAIFNGRKNNMKYAEVFFKIK